VRPVDAASGENGRRAVPAPERRPRPHSAPQVAGIDPARVEEARQHMLAAADELRRYATAAGTAAELTRAIAVAHEESMRAQLLLRPIRNR
jgi:hypothetical protein